MNSTSVKTAAAISGRAIGTLFFAGFGSLWLGTGLAAAHRLNIMSGAGVVIVFALLVIPAVRLLGRVAKASKTGINAEQERQLKRIFTLVNTQEDNHRSDSNPLTQERPSQNEDQFRLAIEPRYRQRQ